MKPSLFLLVAALLLFGCMSKTPRGDWSGQSKITENVPTTTAAATLADSITTNTEITRAGQNVTVDEFSINVIQLKKADIIPLTGFDTKLYCRMCEPNSCAMYTNPTNQKDCLNCSSECAKEVGTYGYNLSKLGRECLLGEEKDWSVYVFEYELQNEGKNPACFSHEFRAEASDGRKYSPKTPNTAENAMLSGGCSSFDRAPSPLLTVQDNSDCLDPLRTQKHNVVFQIPTDVQLKGVSVD